MDVRDARQEAQDLVGPDLEARVLEPSPPTDTEAPWFADDPVAPGAAARPVVSPVDTGDVTWDDWLAEHPRHRAWAARRWLGGIARIGPAPDTLAATRLALHRVAAYVMSPARRRANGRIALRWTCDGFGSPFFGDDEQVRVEGADLVVQRGGEGRRRPVTTLDEAAVFVSGGVPDVPWAQQFDIPPPGDTAAPLDVDPVAARWLGDWFGFATRVLETVRADGASTDASRTQLWPEHFDVAFECLSEHDRRRAGFGASPGDDARDEPYLYVTLWFPGIVGDDPLWNAEHFGGAVLGLHDLLDADDQLHAAVTFLRERRDALAIAD